MIKKNSTTLITLLFSLTIHANDPQLPNKKNNPTQEETKIEECKKQHGEKFIKCIQSLSNKDKKLLLKNLTPQQRKEFFKSLDSTEKYNKFLDCYNEYEWKRLFIKLSPEEKKHYPKTVQAQRIAIAKIKYEGEHGGTSYQRLSFIIDLLPQGNEFRTKAETKLGLSKTRTQIKEKIEKKFKEYMEKKFDTN